MRYEKMFVLKKVWKISIAALHCLTQDVQHATTNLRRTSAGAYLIIICFLEMFSSQYIRLIKSREKKYCDLRKDSKLLRKR